MNEMVIYDAKTPSSINFKDEALQRVSLAIAENMAEVGRIYNDAKERTEAVNRALAPLFAEVVNGKLYEKGGYKSLDAYSEEVFGIKKSMAYMLARVGNAFFLTDNEYTKKARETFSVSTLGELCNSDRVAIAGAIDSGELNSETEQKAVREWGATHRKDGKGAKEKVLPTFNVMAVDNHAMLAENVDKEAMYACVTSFFADNGLVAEGAVVMFTTVKLDGDKPSAAQHFIAYTSEGYTRMYEYRPYVKPANKGKGKCKGEKFDLASYIAALSPEERKALADMVSSNS